MWDMWDKFDSAETFRTELQNRTNLDNAEQIFSKLLHGKIVVDTVENEALKVCQALVQS